jgi:hypothetical protein
MNAHASRNKSYRRWQWLAALTLLALAALPISGHGRGRADDDDDNKNSPTPPGLFITPMALSHALQQELNPGLMNYPNFVAGEAVKAVVSPDEKTLAILTAGMNSLYFPNVGEPATNPNIGKVDTAASTQFLFLYDISGANKSSPVLKQVIQQLNADVGLVWAPDSKTLYAAGGCDDVAGSPTMVTWILVSHLHGHLGCSEERLSFELDLASTTKMGNWTTRTCPSRTRCFDIPYREKRIPYWRFQSIHFL